MIIPNVNENAKKDEKPNQLAMRLATEKAMCISKQYPESIVIGADQVASINGMPIGKPKNFYRAKNQLHEFSGKYVVFYTAVAVTNGEHIRKKNVATYCKFRELDSKLISVYLKLEEPYNSAGSIKTEGLGITLFEKIESRDPTAIIGLPLIAVSKMLRFFKIEPILMT